MDREAALREQHKQRMAFMPWLYFEAKPHVRAWAEAWQAEVHARLTSLERVNIHPRAFIAEEARLFAEPRREITLDEQSSVAAHAVLHGPLTIGAHVSINPFVNLDGGKAGIVIGAGTRIATRASMFAFDHGMDPAQTIRAQPVRSRGIRIGRDVWIGAHACITDGVTIADHAVVGAGAVVTRNVGEFEIVGGVPAVVIGDRRRS